jgi:hypothetical protein
MKIRDLSLPCRRIVIRRERGIGVCHAGLVPGAPRGRRIVIRRERGSTTRSSRMTIRDLPRPCRRIVIRRERRREGTPAAGAHPRPWPASLACCWTVVQQERGQVWASSLFCRTLVRRERRGEGAPAAGAHPRPWPASLACCWTVVQQERGQVWASPLCRRTVVRRGRGVGLCHAGLVLGAPRVWCLPRERSVLAGQIGNLPYVACRSLRASWPPHLLASLPHTTPA